MDKPTKGKFYLTAAIPYVNGKPHIGHALEFVQADAIKRYKKISNYRPLFVCGSDENGLKIVEAAKKLGITPEALANQNTILFKSLVKRLEIGIDIWKRGSDKEYHWPGTEKLWRLCKEGGDIYKKNYGGYYCVGCEDFYTKKDLVKGLCPEHLTEPEWVEEENYFFKLKKYEAKILKLIVSDRVKIFPQTKKNEVVRFVKSGLSDFSISRSKTRAKNWGIPVPDDPKQVIYTWYDALNIYQTAVGFGYDEENWQKWWPADLHVIGKGILRFHAVYWIGILLSAKLPLPKSIFAHGYVSSGGQKMSKTLGNVVDPFEVIAKYGPEATRYYLLREIPSFGDGDFTFSRFEQLYSSDLANGLGNTVSRVAALCEKSGMDFIPDSPPGLRVEVKERLEDYRFDLALEEIWKEIGSVDLKIEREKPWSLPGKKLRPVLTELVAQLRQIGYELEPFLPRTSQKISKIFAGPEIKATKPLFPRFQ